MSSNKKPGRRGSSVRASNLSAVDSTLSVGSLFGDMFQSRGEYTTGLFYAGRMRYMHANYSSLINSRAGTAPTGPLSALQPPTEFMTIRQRRDFLRLEKAGTHSAGFQRLEFKKLVEVEDRPGRAAGRGPQGKGIVHNQVKTVTIQKYPSVDPRDWREENQAGCRFYVHRITGEASDEKPWVNIQRQQSDPVKGQFEEPDTADICLGTGSLVYDGSELDDLFKILDEQKRSEFQNKATGEKG